MIKGMFFLYRVVKANLTPSKGLGRYLLSIDPDKDDPLYTPLYYVRYTVIICSIHFERGIR